VIQRNHEGRQAQNVRQQDELLPVLGAVLTGAGEEIDGGEPFGFGQFNFPREVVQVAHQRADQLPRARRDLCAHSGQHCVGEGGDVEVAHARLLRLKGLD